MIRLIFKNLWTRKKRNGWLLAELVAVSIILWHFADPLTVQTYIDSLPDGYEKDGLYRISFSAYPSSSSLYNEEAEQIESQRSNMWRLLEQVRRYPGVESATFQSGGNGPGGTVWWIGGYNFKDSTMTSAFDVQYVPQSDYFKTYGFKSAGGPSIAEIDSMGFRDNERIMTEGALDDGPMLGRTYNNVWRSKEKIIATVQPVKIRPDHAPQHVMFHQVHAENSAIVFRLRKGIDEDGFLSDFRPWAQKTLKAGNFFVVDVTSYNVYIKRTKVWTDYDYRINMILMSFFLFCLFFGVSGAFWMQTRSRCEEIGIMKSFGATSGKVIRLFLTEGLILTTVAVLAGSLIYMQYALHEGFYIPERFNQGDLAHYWYESFKAHFAVIMAIVWLLTAFVVSIGISIPAWGISRMAPTEALHEE